MIRKAAVAFVLLYAVNVGVLVGATGCCEGVGCGKKGAVVATVATVKTLDEAIKIFVGWAVPEEEKIANDAIAVCAKTTLPFGECVHGEAEKRRAPIDRVKAAMKFYDAALAAGQAAAGTGTITQAATALMGALDGVGIHVGGL